MNDEPLSLMEKRIRLSGSLLLIGLLVEVFSLLWSHPTAFIVFFVVGGLSMAAGILIFLYSLVSIPGDPAKKDS